MPSTRVARSFLSIRDPLSDQSYETYDPDRLHQKAQFRGLQPPPWKSSKCFSPQAPHVDSNIDGPVLELTREKTIKHRRFKNLDRVGESQAETAPLWVARSPHIGRTLVECARTAVAAGLAGTSPRIPC